MLKSVLGLLILVILAYLGSRHSFHRQILKKGLYSFFLTGTEYIFVGFLLGPTILDVLNPETLADFKALVIFGLAFVGFLTGSQFEWRYLKRYPRQLYLATAAIDLVTFCLVFLVFYGLFLWIGDLRKLPHHALLILAISAVGAAPSSVMMVLQKYPRFKQLPNLLQFVSGFGDLIMVALFGILFSFEDPETHRIKFEFMGGFYWLLICISFGGLCGVAFYLALANKQTKNEYLALLIGLLAFCGGLAAKLHLSPIFLSAVAGIVYANLPKIRVMESAPMVLARTERPFYLILLLVVGALWQPADWWVLLLALVYCAFRLLGKVIGGRAVRLLFPQRDAPPEWLGIGLMAQGGVAIAIILNYQIGYPGEATQISVTVMIVALVVNELVSPTLLEFLCQREMKLVRTAVKL